MDEVTVEHETDRYHYSNSNSSSGWDCITRTSAQISYEANGGITEGTVTKSRTQKKSFPEPEWTTGESLKLYVDPKDGTRCALFDESRERDLFRDTPLEVNSPRGYQGPSDPSAFPVHHGPAERPGSPQSLSHFPRTVGAASGGSGEVNEKFHDPVNPVDAAHRINAVRLPNRGTTKV